MGGGETKVFRFTSRPASSHPWVGQRWRWACWLRVHLVDQTVDGQVPRSASSVACCLAKESSVISCPTPSHQVAAAEVGLATCAAAHRSWAKKVAQSCTPVRSFPTDPIQKCLVTQLCHAGLCWCWRHVACWPPDTEYACLDRPFPSVLPFSRNWVCKPVFSTLEEEVLFKGSSLRPNLLLG